MVTDAVEREERGCSRRGAESVLLAPPGLVDSAIKARLPWLDRLLVTPQVHRIHHSRDPGHYNRNFADAFPLFDILFGTYHKPAAEEFPETGLGGDYPAPRSLWAAQGKPAVLGFRRIAGRASRNETAMELSQS